jgi:hypothetical protein
MNRKKNTLASKEADTITPKPGLVFVWYGHMKALGLESFEALREYGPNTREVVEASLKRLADDVLAMEDPPTPIEKTVWITKFKANGETENIKMSDWLKEHREANPPE